FCLRPILGRCQVRSQLMKRVIVAGAFLLANVVAPAMADCVSTSNGTNIGTAAIKSLLAPGNTYPSGTYACYNNGSRRENNEYLYSTSQFYEFHNGGSTVQ